MEQLRRQRGVRPSSSPTSRGGAHKTGPFAFDRVNFYTIDVQNQNPLTASALSFGSAHPFSPAEKKPPWKSAAGRAPGECTCGSCVRCNGARPPTHHELVATEDPKCQEGRRRAADRTRERQEEARLTTRRVMECTTS